MSRTNLIKFSTLSPDGTLTLNGFLDRNIIMRCPFVSCELQHYRADGSCKCDDAEERKRLIKEHGYSDADFAKIKLRT